VAWAAIVWRLASYRDELKSLAAGAGLTVHHTLTRDPPSGWRGLVYLFDAEMLRTIGPGSHGPPRIFVCGPTSDARQLRRSSAAQERRTSQIVTWPPPRRANHTLTDSSH
jgi:NAD(P)H-flavin reductase